MAHPPHSLAARLNRLFATIRPGPEELAQRRAARAGRRAARADQRPATPAGQRPTTRPAGDPGSGPAGREWFNSEVADRINGPGEVAERIGRTVGPVSISGAYIGELRQGKVTDPRLSHLKALAIAFGVPVGYFLGDDAGSGPGPGTPGGSGSRISGAGPGVVQPELLRDVLAGTGLSDRSQAAMTAIFEQLLEVEGLTPDRERHHDR